MREVLCIFFLCNLKKLIKAIIGFRLKSLSVPKSFFCRDAFGTIANTSGPIIMEALKGDAPAGRNPKPAALTFATGRQL